MDTNTVTFLKLRRNQINAKDRLLRSIYPRCWLTGHFIGGKPVASRAWLVTPFEADVQQVLACIGLVAMPMRNI